MLPSNDDRTSSRRGRRVGSICAAFILGAALCASAHAAEQDAAAPGGAPGAITGVVSETMSTAGYTYVQIEANGEKVWAAAPRFEVSVGDTVTIPPGSPMPGYHSKTLDRSFDMVYFVGQVKVAGATASPSAGLHRSPGQPAAPTAAEIDVSGVQKAEGGHTVGEVFDRRVALSGQPVVVRGKVVKFSPQVMGKNWVHVKDGTAGRDGGDDLTVTTSGVAAVGDTVLIRGALSIDRDFGYGYKYEVLVEDADVAVE